MGWDRWDAGNFLTSTLRPGPAGGTSPGGLLPSTRRPGARAEGPLVPHRAVSWIPF